MKKITFKNLPDETTPINEDNLNKLQDNVEEELSKKVDISGISLDDWNDAIEEGKKYYSSNITQNSPFAFAVGYIVTRPTSQNHTQIIQIAVEVAGSGGIRTRFGDKSPDGTIAWQSWSFPKRTTSANKDIDWNELTEADTYFFASHATGANKASTEFGMLEVFANGSSFVMQRFTKFDGSEVYTRGKYASSDWSAWKKWT